MPSVAPARTRSDEERLSPARRRELAEDFSRLVAERRAGVARTERAATSVEERPRATPARRADFSGTVHGTLGGSGAGGAADRTGAPFDAPGGEGTRASAARDGLAAPGTVPSRRDESVDGVAAASSPPPPPSAWESSASVAMRGETAGGACASRRPSGGAEGGVETLGDAPERAEGTRRPRGARDEERVDEGAARETPAAAAPGVAAFATPGAENGLAAADGGAEPAPGAVAERVAEAAEAIGTLLADTERFAELPEEGCWRFTLLDDEVSLGFVVTRDAAGARSVAVDGDDGRYAPLLGELRRRLAALEVDVTVEGAPS